MSWLIRTMVPIIVGTIITFLADYGIKIDSGALSVVVTGAVIGVYVLVARWIEKTWPGSIVARMMMSLGLAPKQPVYAPVDTGAQTT